MNNDNVTQFATITDIQVRLGVSRKTVERLMRREVDPLPYVNIGSRKPVIPWEQFEIWLKNNPRKEN